jgi:uncharacterized protein (TIGR02001 family)
MNEFGRIGRVLTASGVMMLALGGAALADGYSTKDAPVEEGRKFSYSVTVGGTSDYVFRGITQTSEDPAFQAALDLSYGLFYAGIWGSNIDFEPAGSAEIDLYAGIKPTWGPVTFDLGAIYYWYPGADDGGAVADLDYVELKAGYSIVSPWIKNLVSGTTLYWTPENTGETGEVFTLESVAAYTLPQFGMFTPTISGTYGSVYGDLGDGFNIDGAGEDEYKYWNVGLVLAVEKFTFDFRYWDTDIDAVGGGFCANQGLCDERFVFSAKVMLP